MRTGMACLPLHTGKAPAWLFNRMRKLAREIILLIVSEGGVRAVFEKLSDPFWFQAFGCALGFDWHSSGLTTTVCGVLKEGLQGLERDTGIHIGGGKGAASRKTPLEIRAHCEKLAKNPEPLIYASRLSAKVDNTAVQDGYTLYHHTFFFTETGEWAVIQQGMNENNHFARRYHWWSHSLKDFVDEPHTAICAEIQSNHVINFVANESSGSRQATTLLAKENPETIFKEWKKIEELHLPVRHNVEDGDIDPKRFYRVLESTYAAQAPDFEKLLGVKGLGPKSLRALSLVTELVYGERPSFQDPARFSFAHGGKDGHPYPVARKTYDQTIEILRDQINRSRMDPLHRHQALRRLARF